MAITWDWKNKIGSLDVMSEINDDQAAFSIDIYTGNVDLIFILHYFDKGTEYYTLYNFFCDIQHLKRCTASDKNFFKGYDTWQTITFYECNTKLCRFANEFFKNGIEIRFTHEFDDEEEKQ